MLLRTAVEAHGLGGQQRLAVLHCCACNRDLMCRPGEPWSGRGWHGRMFGGLMVLAACTSRLVVVNRHLPLTKSLRSGIIGATWMTD
jgi:hypothetical protein